MSERRHTPDLVRANLLAVADIAHGFAPLGARLIRFELPGPEAFTALVLAGATVKETLLTSSTGPIVARVATLVLNGMETTAQLTRPATPEEAARLDTDAARNVSPCRFLPL